jgi:hypothetical protein
MEAPSWRRILHGGAGPQAPEDGGVGGPEQLPGFTPTAATLAAAGEARGGEAVSIAASTTTAAANTAAPGITTTTTTVAARAAGPASAARDTIGEKAPPVDRGIFLRKEGYPDHSGRMGDA